MKAVAKQILTGPFQVRTYRELGYCWLTVLPAVPSFALVLVALIAGVLGLLGIGLLILPLILIVARSIVPWFGRAGRVTLKWPWRALPARRVRVWRDRPAWGALAYLAAKLPLMLTAVYFSTIAIVVGLAALTSPLWWFIDHDGFGAWDNMPWIGTVAFAVEGAALLLAFPWLVRLLVAMDRTVLFALVVSNDERRIAALEAGRRTLTDNATTALRRIERDLHDGTQARLVSLGIVLDRIGRRVDDAQTRVLVDTATRQTGDALVELRDIIRGLRPPALDDGLATALATLVARSGVPSTLEADWAQEVPEPASSAVYFAASELLTNVARHSGATRAVVRLANTATGVRLTVTDNGRGGATMTGPSGGLSGLRRRAEALDGTLSLSSPCGGPTIVTIDVTHV